MKLTAYEHKMEQKAWGIIRVSCIPLVALKWFTMKQLGTHVLVAAIPPQHTRRPGAGTHGEHPEGLQEG